jgi:hypothetical protein
MKHNHLDLVLSIKHNNKPWKNYTCMLLASMRYIYIAYKDIYSHHTNVFFISSQGALSTSFEKKNLQEYQNITILLVL